MFEDFSLTLQAAHSSNQVHDDVGELVEPPADPAEARFRVGSELGDARARVGSGFFESGFHVGAGFFESGLHVGAELGSFGSGFFESGLHVGAELGSFGSGFFESGLHVGAELGSFGSGFFESGLHVGAELGVVGAAAAVEVQEQGQDDPQHRENGLFHGPSLEVSVPVWGKPRPHYRPGVRDTTVLAQISTESPTILSSAAREVSRAVRVGTMRMLTGFAAKWPQAQFTAAAHAPRRPGCGPRAPPLRCRRLVDAAAAGQGAR